MGTPGYMGTETREKKAKKVLKKQNNEFSKGSPHPTADVCTQGVPTYPCTQAISTLKEGN